MVAEQEYLWSDAWLLQAIIHSNLRGDGSLDQILMEADSIQITPILHDELESGLVRLTNGGFIIEHDEKFSPTGKVPEEMRLGLKPAYRDLEPIRAFLRAEPWSSANSVRDPRNNLKYSGLSKERLHKVEKLAHKNPKHYLA
jgi:hypothetical protein